MKKISANKTPTPRKHTTVKLVILLPLLMLILIVYSYIGFVFYFQNKIFPGVYVGEFSLSGESYTQALNKLNKEYADRLNTPINLQFNHKSFQIDPNYTHPEIDLKTPVTESLSFGKSGQFLKDLQSQFQALIYHNHFNPSVKFNGLVFLNSKLVALNNLVKSPAINADLNLTEEVSVIPSQNGQELDEQSFKKEFEDYLSLNSGQKPELKIKNLTPGFTTEDANFAKEALLKIKDSQLKLTYLNQSWQIDQATLYSLLDLEAKPQTPDPVPTLRQDSGQAPDDPVNMKLLFASKNLPDKYLKINQNKLTSFLGNMAHAIDQEPIDAKFEIVDKTLGSIKVKEFRPSQTGRKLDTAATAKLIAQVLTGPDSDETHKLLAQPVSLPVEEIAPKITTDNVNNFGIKELVGEGVSNFSGSIENRVYNIGLAAWRINGTLIPPGATFSFNQTVGDISAGTGYKPAYVIKSGRTVLDDGGGVCQVSTTIFRAALNSGLPVLERTAHAYRVGYYEQGFPPGLDATVFYPSVDLKFKNDTDFYVLMQAKLNGQSLTVDLYGSKDGRLVEISTPKVTNQTPPPTEIRQDDPSLSKGVVKQVDWPAWGANVSFTRKVSKNGEMIIDEIWRSNFRPWQAVYLVGTKEG